MLTLWPRLGRYRQKQQPLVAACRLCVLSEVALVSCGGSNPSVPISVRDATVQSIYTAGNVYTSFPTTWAEVSSQKAAAWYQTPPSQLPTAGRAYVVELRGEFDMKLDPANSGKSLLIVIPAGTWLGTSFVLSGVRHNYRSFRGLGAVHHVKFLGLAREARGRIPDVVGLTFPAANPALSGSGVKVYVLPVHNSLLPTGTITKQSHAPGLQAHKGEHLDLSVVVEPG